MPRRGPYGLPKRKAYMIYDLSHSRDAMGKAKQHATPAERRQLARAIYKLHPRARKWPSVRKALGMKPLRRKK